MYRFHLETHSAFYSVPQSEAILQLVRPTVKDAAKPQMDLLLYLLLMSDAVLRGSTLEVTWVSFS